MWTRFCLTLDNVQWTWIVNFQEGFETLIISAPVCYQICTNFICKACDIDWGMIFREFWMCHWLEGWCFLGHLHLQAELEREPSLIQQKSTAAVAAYQRSDDQHGKSKLFCTDAISSQKWSTSLIEHHRTTKTNIFLTNGSKKEIKKKLQCN